MAWDYQKQKNMARMYGVSEESWKLKLAMQDGRCAICKTDLYEDKAPHTDHDHETGVFRGILCSNCNTGIGMFKEDPWILDQAIQYVKRSQEARRTS